MSETGRPRDSARTNLPEIQKMQGGVHSKTSVDELDTTNKRSFYLTQAEFGRKQISAPKMVELEMEAER